MLRALRRRAPLALAVAGAISVAIAGTSGTVAQASGGSTPYWGTATTISSLGEALFIGAVCPNTTTCLAGGQGVGPAGSSPVVAAESGGTWGAESTVPITGVSSPDGVYDSLSCTSASLCVGVGSNSQSGADVPIAGPILLSGTTTATAVTASQVTLPSSPAGAATEAAGLSSASCTASGCTAVGSYLTSGGKEEPFVATSNGAGSWSAATVAPPSAATGGANLTAVSCPSSGACEAVGNYVDGSGHIQNWSVQLGGGTPQTITLPSSAVAVSSSLPSPPSVLSFGSEQMTGISCPSSGVCTAVGSFTVSSGAVNAVAVSISNGAPATGTALPAPAGLALTAITGLWCSDASDCTADGDVITTSPTTTVSPVVLSEGSGTWSGLTDIPGTAMSATSESLVLGLGCSAVTTCMTTGAQVNSATSAVLPQVDFSAPPLSVTTASLPAATAGVPYDATLQGAGGTGTGTWSINGSLPAGLSLNASTGVISGTPVVPGSNSFSAQLASAGPPVQTASVNLSISVVAVPKLSVGTAKVTAAGVKLSLGCSGSGTCSGTALVTAVEHLTGKKVTAVTARAKKRKVTITLAHGSYSLTAGNLGTINLKLTAKAQRLLAQLHKISGRLTVTPTGATKPTVTRTVTFKSATKKKR